MRLLFAFSAALLVAGLAASYDSSLYARNDDLYARDEGELHTRDYNDLYAREDEELYARGYDDLDARDAGDLYARDDELYARDHDEIYARDSEVIYARDLEAENFLNRRGLAEWEDMNIARRGDSSLGEGSGGPVGQAPSIHGLDAKGAGILDAGAQNPDAQSTDPQISGSPGDPPGGQASGSRSWSKFKPKASWLNHRPFMSLEKRLAKAEREWAQMEQTWETVKAKSATQATDQHAPDSYKQLLLTKMQHETSLTKLQRKIKASSPLYPRLEHLLGIRQKIMSWLQEYDAGPEGESLPSLQQKADGLKQYANAFKKTQPSLDQAPPTGLDRRDRMGHESRGMVRREDPPGEPPAAPPGSPSSLGANGQDQPPHSGGSDLPGSHGHAEARATELGASLRQKEQQYGALERRKAEPGANVHMLEFEQQGLVIAMAFDMMIYSMTGAASPSLFDDSSSMSGSMGRVHTLSSSSSHESPSYESSFYESSSHESEAELAERRSVVKRAFDRLQALLRKTKVAAKKNPRSWFNLSFMRSLGIGIRGKKTPASDDKTAPKVDRRNQMSRRSL